MSEHDETTDEVAQMPGPDAEMPTVDEAVEQVQDEAQPEPPIETECAFVMFLVNGHWVADGSLLGREIKSAREASFDDFQHAAGVLLSDLQARRSAEQVVGLQLQQAQQMAQHQRDAEINAKIAKDIAEGRNLAGAKLLG